MESLRLDERVKVPSALAHPVTEGVDVDGIGAESDNRQQRVTDYPQVVGEALAELLLEVMSCTQDVLGRLGIAAGESAMSECEHSLNTIVVDDCPSTREDGSRARACHGRAGVYSSSPVGHDVVLVLS